MVSGVFCSSCTANFSCARIPQRGLGRTVSISLAYMFMSPLIIGSLIQLHARSPPRPDEPVINFGHCTGALVDGLQAQAHVTLPQAALLPGTLSFLRPLVCKEVPRAEDARDIRLL